jgi:hypothetical protein
MEIMVCLGKGYGTSRRYTTIGASIIGDRKFELWVHLFEQLCGVVEIIDWYIETQQNDCWIVISPEELQKFLKISSEEFTALMLESL